MLFSMMNAVDQVRTGSCTLPVWERFWSVGENRLFNNDSVHCKVTQISELEITPTRFLPFSTGMQEIRLPRIMLIVSEMSDSTSVVKGSAVIISSADRQFFLFRSRSLMIPTRLPGASQTIRWRKSAERIRLTIVCFGVSGDTHVGDNDMMSPATIALHKSDRESPENALKIRSRFSRSRAD